MIESFGQISTTEVFVSGWSRAEIADGTPVTIVTDDRLVPGELTVIRADRPDVGARAGFCGVVQASRPLEAAAVGGLRFVTGDALERYDRAVAHGTAQCVEILRVALSHRPVSEAREQALSNIAHRYWGQETISSSPLPVRMGIDDCVLLSRQVVFLRGWFVDPERLCTRVDLASRNGGSRIDDHWLAQSRPDVGAMLASDARLAGYDRHADLCGFVAFVESDDWSDDLHLVLTIADGPALYQPLHPRRGDIAALLRSILRASDPGALGIEPIIGSLARSLAAAKADPPVLVEDDAQPPAAITLVLSCLGDVEDLMMRVTTLAADPEVQDVAIVVAGPREVIAACGDRLRQHATLLEVRLALVSGSRIDDDFDALQVGTAAAESDLICLLPVGAVPRGNGWLSRMLAERQRRPGSAVLAFATEYRNGEARAVSETPAAYVLNRGDILTASPDHLILSVAGKWDALASELRVGGTPLADLPDPLFVAAPAAVTPAERLLRRVDDAAGRLRQS
jgi:hypothetical protein